ncbi:protein kinase [Streptomyces sp. NPDC048845]|uniref:protein kinase n=1 Tax=Streptomyces sp. NPDC048845 TaxID=3155390 RepID=UPI00343F5E17
MEDYAGRVLADRYRLPRPPADACDIVETRAFDTYSGQEVTVRQVPLPETVEAEVPGPDGSWGAPGTGRATRRPGDPVVRRALDAATAAAAVPDHPRLDQVFDVFAEDGGLWIVSEYVPGRPLAALLAEDTLSPHRAAEVAADILTALRALHALGWVHRNITARTVLVCDDGRAVLTGLAAGAAEEALCGYDPTPPPETEPGDGPGGPGGGDGTVPGGGAVSGGPGGGRGPASGGPGPSGGPAVSGGGASGFGAGPGGPGGSGPAPGTSGGSGASGTSGAPGGGPAPGASGGASGASPEGAGVSGGAVAYRGDAEVAGVDAGASRGGPGGTAGRPGTGPGSGGTAGRPRTGPGPGGTADADGSGRGPHTAGTGSLPALPDGRQPRVRAVAAYSAGARAAARASLRTDGRGDTGRSGPQDLGPVPGPHLPGPGQRSPGQQSSGQQQSGHHAPGHQTSGPQAPGGGAHPPGLPAPGQSAPGRFPQGQPASGRSTQGQPASGQDRGAGWSDAGAGATGTAASGTVPGQSLPGRPALGGLPGVAGLPPGFLPGGGPGTGPAAPAAPDTGGGSPGLPGGGPGPLGNGTGPGPLGAGTPTGATGPGPLGTGPVGPRAPGAGTPEAPGAVQAGWHGSTGRPGQPGRPAPEPESGTGRTGPAPAPQRRDRSPAGPVRLPARYDRPTEEPYDQEDPRHDDPRHDEPQDRGAGRTSVQPYGQTAPERGERSPYDRGEDRLAGRQPYDPAARRQDEPQPYEQETRRHDGRQPYGQGSPPHGEPRGGGDRAAVQPYGRRDTYGGQPQERGGFPGAVQPYDRGGRDDRATGEGTRPGRGAHHGAPVDTPAGAPRSGTAPAVAASRWDDLVAAGRGPGGLRGPATPLAAERARQARLVVVGAVTERWAPEQAGPVRGNWQLAPPIGPATDLWAVGALLFRAVQGHAPYPEESAAELVQLVCTEAPAFAEECGALRPVVESLLRQDPAERPEFEELRGWLRSLIRTAPEPDLGSRTVTVPSTGPEEPRDPRRLPVLRRRGELVRRRRGAAQAVVHGRHKRAKEHRRGPRSLGRTLLMLILLALAGAVAYAMLFMPRAGETGNSGADRTGAAGAASSAPDVPPADSGDDPDEGAGRTNGGSGEREPESSGSPQTSEPANLAKGFGIRKDPAGFQVAVHEDWQRQGENSLGQIRYTRGRFELVVVPGRDGVDEFGNDPMAYQQDAERELASFRESQWSSASGLRRIDVGDTAMAEGAFTWRDDSDREVHTRNLAMILDGRYHVVQVTGPVADKQEVAHHFEQATATYRTTG